MLTGTMADDSEEGIVDKHSTQHWKDQHQSTKGIICQNSYEIKNNYIYSNKSKWKRNTPWWLYWKSRMLESINSGNYLQDNFDNFVIVITTPFSQQN